MRKDIVNAAVFTATGAAMGVAITLILTMPCAPAPSITYAAMLIEPHVEGDLSAIVEPLEDRLNRGVVTAPVGI